MCKGCKFLIGLVIGFFAMDIYLEMKGEWE